MRQVGRSGSTTEAFTSDVFKHYYKQSAIGCRDNKDLKMCQVLANLCVLNLYSEATFPCKLFRKIQDEQQKESEQVTFYKDDGWKEGMPWLYYSQTPQQVFKESELPELTVSFDDPGNDLTRMNKLKFWLARYTMDGEFLALQELTNELSSCPMDMEEVQMMATFGFVTENNCEFKLFNLIKNDPQYLPLQANAFFELYLEDSKKQLVDVPVLIKNFKDINGESPNSSYDLDTSRLVHRFFIYDTISGIKQGRYIDNAAPSIVRFASKVKVTVQMDPSQEESIRKPLLEIEYSEFQTSLIDEKSEVPASFYFEYYEDGANFEESAEITVYVMNALVLLVVALKMYYWVKMNPPRFRQRKFGAAFAGKLLLILCDVWSNIMFMVYFILTGYWFIMYKMQSNAYILLPQRNIENSTYDLFKGFLIAITVTKGLAIVLTILNQSQADVFIMDWERFEQMKTIEVVDNSPEPAAAAPAAAPAANGGANGNNDANNGGDAAAAAAPVK